MNSVPFQSPPEVTYAVVETVAPLIRRVVARNPSRMTARGTATYIVGHGQVAVIDPGPALAEHVDALLAALRGETVAHILVTHTHRDHSPAAAAIRAATGAPTLGYGPHGGGEGEFSDGGADLAFVPDRALGDGDAVEGKGYVLRAVHTPGHTSNHLCFALEEPGGGGVLFPGDHVMGWSTSVVVPPDGDMRAYVRSLEKLLARDDGLYMPTHGAPIADPKPYVRALIAHRHERTAGILARLRAGDRRIPELVAALYAGLPDGLRRPAGWSVLAHLIELIEDGRVACEGKPGLEGEYRVRG